uniref:Uncharacterized protein n=1 Tax=Rhizophora mucronata TaxID=61149 RepID=A0A2P2IWB6_RHIMU
MKKTSLFPRVPRTLHHLEPIVHRQIVYSIGDSGPLYPSWHPTFPFFSICRCSKPKSNGPKTF